MATIKGDLRLGSMLVIVTCGLAAAADDGVTVTKAVDHWVAAPGDPLVYTVEVTHTDNPQIATGLFEDDLPAELTSCSWTCAVTGSGWCELDAGTGDIFQLVWVPFGESATIQASCTFSPPPEARYVVNTASFSTMDPDTFNQGSATTWNVVWLVFADDFESGGTPAWSSVIQ